jgi:S1-C subfamily serine protease
MAVPSAGPRRELGQQLRAVVKVFTVSDPPDYEQPWQTRGPTTSTGSGAVVETERGPRVLTNAHCVDNHVFVEVRRYGKSHRFPAEVEAIGHECDLALLNVADAGFFAGADPILLGDLPSLSDRVSVCGFPVGGERLSVTEGIVSRIEVVRYTQRRRRLLAIQIDAAINSGNSGGPVLRDGKMVGVAFQALDDAASIGYMIATPVVDHFLRDVDAGRRDGFPSLGVHTQPLESASQRRWLGLPEDSEDGIMVTRIAYGGSAWGVLRRGDVLLAVDGEPIAADGTFAFRDGERLTWDYTISRATVGESVPLTIWRDRAEMCCLVPLKPPQYLVAEDRYDVDPSYYVFGGLLLVPLTRDYLKTWGDQWWSTAPRDLVATYENDDRTPDRTEPVVLQKVLADTANHGYHDFENLLIRSVDGVRVRSLSHLVGVVESGTAPFVCFESELGHSIVLERSLAEARQQDILDRYGVPRDRSDDLNEPSVTETG